MLSADYLSKNYPLYIWLKKIRSLIVHILIYCNNYDLKLVSDTMTEIIKP